MDQLSRRATLKVVAAGAAGVLVSPAAAQDETTKGDKAPADAANADRGFVMAAGMTEGEADCWEHAAKTAGAFFALPELHPMDRQEVATAIHVIQNKLLSRPTYRTYLKAAGAPNVPE